MTARVYAVKKQIHDTIARIQSYRVPATPLKFDLCRTLSNALEVIEFLERENYKLRQQSGDVHM